MKRLLMCGLMGLVMTGAMASDHVDGPETTVNSHGDLTDLYAFPTNGGRSIAVVLSVHPFRSRLDSLNDGIAGLGVAGLDHDITLKIHIAKLALQGTPVQMVPQDDRYVLTCTFRELNTMTCADTDGRSIRTPFEQAVEADGAKLFFGKSADPFFFDAEWAICVTRFQDRDSLEKASGTNSLWRQNVLSLVLEIDADRLFDGTAGLIGIVGQSLVDGQHYDRVGRPEATNVFLATRQVPTATPELRDSFNRLPAYADVKDLYRQRIAETVEMHDKLYGAEQWTPAQTDHFAKVMAADVLSMDVSRLDFCHRDPFLDIEIEMILGNPGSHKSCGGRGFRDDVMDKIYGLLFAKGSRLAPGDKVGIETLDFRNGFPYVPEPYTLSMGLPAQIALSTADPTQRPALCE